MNRVREIGRIPAASPDGGMYEIVVSQTFVVHKSLNSPEREIPSIRNFRTSTGEDLNFNGNEESPEFEIAESGIILTPC